jgi:hypothetical protein
MFTLGAHASDGLSSYRLDKTNQDSHGISEQHEHLNTPDNFVNSRLNI